MPTPAARIDQAPAALMPVARPSMPGAAAIQPYLEEIDAGRWYSNFGPLVRRLEERLADRLGQPAFATTTSSGTMGLVAGLKAIGAEPGTLCAMPSWTFVATAHAALQAGLTPWFLDVDPDSWMLEPGIVREALARAPGKVGAITPVCAFGRTPDLKPWAALSAETKIPVLVDAAAAFDAVTEAPVPLVVSLHATKVLGAGEGGFVATEDPELAKRLRQMTSFGFAGTREARFPATNAKMSEYAAAVGHAALDGWPATRLRYMWAAQQLRIALSRLPQVRFQPGWGLQWISSVCVVSLPEGSAADVAASLRRAGIDTRRWWGDGCHTNPAFKKLPRRELPATQALAESTLGLPFSADLQPEEIARIASALAAALGGGRAA